ncbi:polysaccharide lyase family 8 super-sandwich domain-containing protein [Flavonifractor hominis]|uniref:polysaccharide lyase family 8 super-sandwich domain-containing protein n=1 Tax=Flavonifractor hominis TaxID=3133178 RepID=UPI0033905866
MGRWDKPSNYLLEQKNKYATVGGTDFFGQYGASAFEVDNGAHSKKSYFFFDDKVVLLGSDISSTSYQRQPCREHRGELQGRAGPEQHRHGGR